MALYPRLLGQGPTSGHIDPGQFVNACMENLQDRLPLEDLATLFSLDADETNDANNFISAIYLPGFSEGTITEMTARNVLSLGRGGLLYTTEQEVRTRLGL